MSRAGTTATLLRRGWRFVIPKAAPQYYGVRPHGNNQPVLSFATFAILWGQTPWQHSRDAVHSGEYGKQIIGRIMLGYFMTGKQ